MEQLYGIRYMGLAGESASAPGIGAWLTGLEPEGVSNWDMRPEEAKAFSTEIEANAFADENGLGVIRPAYPGAASSYRFAVTPIPR